MAEEDPEEKRAKLLKHRGFIVAEIMSTEKTYYEKLRAVRDVFILPLSQTKILNSEEFDLQFGGFKDIFQTHEAMYLQMVRDSENNVLNMGEIFGSFSQRLESYKMYLVRFEEAINQRGVLLTKNRKFATFVEAAFTNPACGGQDIESLLIAPVQRIPRYRLLLEDLLKYTPADHPEHAAVSDSLEKVKYVANQNNEAIRMREKREEIMAVMMRIDPSSRIDLLQDQNRVIVRKGPLLRQCRREIRSFDFYLFSDMLIYCETINLQARYKLKKYFNLIALRINVAPEISDRPHLAFAVESSAKSFIVWAADVQEKKAWVEDINACMQKLRLQVEMDTGLSAPIWLPDASCPFCRICKASFTLIRRRHHCRKCGSVVCNNCSSQRMRLPEVDPDNEVRVCDRCHDGLVQQLKKNLKYKRSMNVDQKMLLMFGKPPESSTPSGKNDTIGGVTIDGSGAYQDMIESLLVDAGHQSQVIRRGSATTAQPQQPHASNHPMAPPPASAAPSPLSPRNRTIPSNPNRTLIGGRPKSPSQS